MFHYEKPVRPRLLSHRNTVLMSRPVVVRFHPLSNLYPIADSYLVQSLRSCQETKWLPLFHATIVTALAQIVIGLRFCHSPWTDRTLVELRFCGLHIGYTP